VGHVARIGFKRNAYKVLEDKTKEREHFEDQVEGGRLILNRVCGLDSSGSEYGAVSEVP
jgi:hypothetical protein